MTKKEFLIKVLYENGDLTGNQITNFFYEQHEDEVEKKRIVYISKGAEKTEKQLKLQIRAEITADVSQNRNKRWNLNYRYITSDKSTPVIYSITEEGKKYYEETYLETIENDIENDIENYIEESIEEEIFENDESTFGYIYLLKSKTFQSTYKIGKSINVDKRVEELKKDATYSTFNLQPVMYISCSDYAIIERVFHKFFENYRLFKGNGLLRDTELFKDLDSIEMEFELFANFLKSNPRYKNVQLIKL